MSSALIRWQMITRLSTLPAMTSPVWMESPVLMASPACRWPHSVSAAPIAASSELTSAALGGHGRRSPTSPVEPRVARVPCSCIVIAGVAAGVRLGDTEAEHDGDLADAGASAARRLPDVSKMSSAPETWRAPGHRRGSRAPTRVQSPSSTRGAVDHREHRGEERRHLDHGLGRARIEVGVAPPSVLPPVLAPATPMLATSTSWTIEPCRRRRRRPSPSAARRSRTRCRSPWHCRCPRRLRPGRSRSSQQRREQHGEEILGDGVVVHVRRAEQAAGDTGDVVQTAVGEGEPEVQHRGSLRDVRLRRSRAHRSPHAGRCRSASRCRSPSPIRRRRSHRARRPRFR